MNLLEKKNYLTYNDTAFIKGIALIFMFIHHFFAYPSWYIEGIRYPSLVNLAEIFKHPFNSVSLFAFLTGYTYYYTKKKDMKYSLKKILDIFIPYVLIYIVFLTIAISTKCYVFNIKDFLLELFALKRPIMRFCWYVIFYIITMLILPLVEKKLNKGVKYAVLYGIILPIIIGTALKGIFIKNEIILDIVNNFIRFFPSVIIGYISSRYELFYKIDDFLKKNIKIKIVYILVLFILAAGSFMGKYYFPTLSIGSIDFINKTYAFYFNLDMLYTPIFIYAIVNISRYICKKVLVVFESIGKYSLLMWFLHCIFFNCCQEIFMPILYMPGNAFLVLIWGLLICYIAAFIFEIPIKKLTSLKNKLIEKEG